MRRIGTLIVTVLLAFPIVGIVASPAHACTDTTDLDGCGKVNAVCQKFWKVNCVG